MMTNEEMGAVAANQRLRMGEIEDAFEALIVATTRRADLDDTPARAAKAWDEMTSGYKESPIDHLKLFDNDHQYSGLVSVAGIQFVSLCEHHLLPFYGEARIEYRPRPAIHTTEAGPIVGLSKLARMFDGYARRLQVQERLTQQALNAVVKALDPVHAEVEVTARHMCMCARGAKSNGMMTTRASA